MKTKVMKKVEMSVAVFVLSGLFINASYVPRGESAFENIDSGVRYSHMKEVLGAPNKKSIAKFYRSHIGSKDVYAKVRDGLPKVDHKYARGLTRTILRESRKYGFDPVFVLAVIQTESQWNRKTIGSVGEIGLMQVRPETAEWMAHVNHITWKGPESLKDPSTNVTFGLAYMARLRKQLGPNSMKYISAYNMGAKAVRRLLAQKITPAEYRHKILANYESIYRGIASTKQL